MRQALPETEVYSFYMDMRMFGPGYEELYKEAQQTYGIHFVRGRISEAAPTIDNRIQIKAEDTLIDRPLKMTVDMLVLIVGIVSFITAMRCLAPGTVNRWVIIWLVIVMVFSLGTMDLIGLALYSVTLAIYLARNKAVAAQQDAIRKAIRARR